MLNKKGGIAAEDMMGILVFMFAIIIAILIFYGCSVSKEKAKYEGLKDFEYDIEVKKALNFFLEMRDSEGRKVSDILAEEQDVGSVESLAKNYFKSNYFTQNSRNWELTMWTGMYEYTTIKEKGDLYTVWAESHNIYYETYIPVIDSDLNSETMKVRLHVAKKRY